MSDQDSANSSIDEAMQRDPTFASTEYLAQFRADIEGFVSREVVESCVTQGVYERPPMAAVRYLAFTDPSGGSSDSFTLAISHPERRATNTRLPP